MARSSAMPMRRPSARGRPIGSWSRILIYLAPEARGKGVGKRLLEALIARSTALGFRQMVAVIGGAHPASIALHATHGFEEIGRIKGSGFKHGRWLDTMLMQRPLGDGASGDPDLAAYPATLFAE